MDQPTVGIKPTFFTPLSNLSKNNRVFANNSSNGRESNMSKSSSQKDGSYSPRRRASESSSANHTPFMKGHPYSSPNRANIPPLDDIPEGNSFDEIPPVDSLFQVGSKQRKTKSNSSSSPSKSSKSRPVGFPNITNETSVTVFGFPSDTNSCEYIVHKFKQFGDVLDVSTSNSNYVTIKYSSEEEAKRVLIYNGTFCGEKPQYMIGVVLTKNIQFPVDSANPITSAHIIKPIETIPIQPPQKIKRPYSVDPDSILKPAKKSKTTLLGKLMSYFS